MGRKPGRQYKAGSFWRQDDQSGLTVRAEQTRPEWQGLIVDKRFWEPRQPQDLVTGVPDNQSVTNARPLPPASFVGPVSTTLTAAAAIGDTVLAGSSVQSFGPGSLVGVMLDSGNYFNTSISNVAPPAGSIRISDALPGKAADGNTVTNYRAPGP